MPPTSESNSKPTEEKTLKEKDKKRQLWALLSSMLGVVAALAAGIGTFFIEKVQGPSSIVFSEQTQHAIDSITANLKEMEKELQGSRELVDRLKSSPPAVVQIARVSVQLDSLQAHVKTLDDAIGLSPDKALAVPLLRKDLDNLKDSYRRDFDSTQGEINRVYDQNKWFLGLMFTMALGLIGLAVSNFLQIRKS